MKFLRIIAAFIAATVLTLAFASCKSSAEVPGNSSADSQAVSSQTSSVNTESGDASGEVSSDGVASYQDLTSDVAGEQEIEFNVTELDDNNEEAAVLSFLINKLGETDSSTGYRMIYNIAGTLEFEGEPYYFVWVRWLVDDGETSHSSRVGEVLVSKDFTKIYDAFADGTKVKVYKVNKLDNPGLGSFTPSLTESSSVEIPYEIEAIGDDERKSAETFITEKYGVKDETNGFDMSYVVHGKIEYNNAPYYLITIRWIVQDDNGQPSHSSRLGEVLLSTDFSVLYQAELLNDVVTVHPNDKTIY